MRAAVLHGREDVRVETVEVPRPAAGEVLVRIEVALTCGTDVKVFRRGYHARMITPPALFGHEMAGVIVEVGPGVSAFQVGQRVVAANSAPCGGCAYCRAGRESLCEDLLFWNGAYAEYLRVPARVVAKNLIALDPHVSFRDAALVEPLACVVRAVEDPRVGTGSSVAIVGTGPIGLMLLALAKRRGARVVAAGRRRGRLEVARRLGADVVLDVAPGDDVADLLREASVDHRGHDMVIEAVGSSETCDASLRSVRRGGLVNLFAGCPHETHISIDVQRLHYEELAVTSTFHHTPATVREAYRMIAAGEIKPGDFVTEEAPLGRLPEVLRSLASGSHQLKTAIIPGR